MRRRDRLYCLVTRLFSVGLLPVALVVAPRRARHVACQWALAARFPAENLNGLTPATRAAFEAARAEALWCHGELIGLTDGYRDAHAQARLFADTVRRAGSPGLAMKWALPRLHGSRATCRQPRWTCGRPRAPDGWSGTARGTISTGSTTTSGGTSSTGRTADHRAFRIRARQSRRLRQVCARHLREIRHDLGHERTDSPAHGCSWRRAGLAAAAGRGGRRGRLPFPRGGHVARVP